MGHLKKRQKKQQQSTELKVSRGTARSGAASWSGGRGDEAMATCGGPEIDWSGRTFAMRFSARLAA
ncbi:MAG: hypothetical protein ISS69_17020 [Phycisphaerae bacterium]|nr:hypothetical protein [Phycisphaerae bacterium]